MISILMVFSGTAWSQQADRLMAARYTAASYSVCEVEQTTGETLSCHGVNPNWQSGAANLGLVEQAGSLFALEYRADSQHHLVRVNPADGSRDDIGLIAPGQLSVSGFCVDPVTQELLFIGYPDAFNRHLYAVDSTTAVATVVVPGVYGWVGSMYGMAIDPNGDGWFITQGQRLWKLTVASGVAFHYGYVAGLPSQFVANANVPYLACREPGVLYADVRTGASQTIQSGLFRIDIATLTATRLSDTLTAGLTFAPGVNAVNYCTPKLNSLGCTPSIGAHGYASVSAVEGLDVWGSNALNNTSGLLLFGASGRNTLPWNGGTLCVKPPLVRTPLRSSGGDAWPAQNCSGRWSLDLNSTLASTPGYAAGTTLDLQWFGRDPALAPPANYQLSDGLELILRP